MRRRPRRSSRKPRGARQRRPRSRSRWTGPWSVRRGQAGRESRQSSSQLCVTSGSRGAAAPSPAQVAALAPHVLNAAREGEAVAQRALDDAARELVALVAALEQHFPGSTPVPVAIAGGLLLVQSPLTAAFRQRLAVHVKR